jgi:ketosteroid isomerase-like protein
MRKVEENLSRTWKEPAAPKLRGHNFEYPSMATVPSCNCTGQRQDNKSNAVVVTKTLQLTRARLRLEERRILRRGSTRSAKQRAEVRQVLLRWAEATRMERRNDILSNHTPDAVFFDVLPPMKYEGVKAYRKSWDQWQPETVGPGLFDLHNLKITVDQDVAFAYAFIHCGGTKPSGEKFEDWVRATFRLRKIDGKWLVAHQHRSMPAAKAE